LLLLEPMSITFEAAVDTLQSMFPSYDKETLSMLLQSNSNNVERTIESVLVMEGTLDSVGSDNLPPYPPPREPQHAAAGSSAGKPVSDFAAPQRPHWQEMPPTRYDGSSSSGSGNGNGSARAGAKRRVELPEDFLRPPGWRLKNVTLGDEQLALMLQNEMFQREARDMLGVTFQRGGPGGVGPAGAGAARPGTSGMPPRAAAATPGAAGSEGIPDLGIIKGLSTLSDQARKSLNGLALRFQARNQGQGQGQQGQAQTNHGGQYNHGSQVQGQGQEQHSSQGAGHSNRPLETRNLLSHGNGNGDDDDFEIISFNDNQPLATLGPAGRSGQQRHILDEVGAGGRLSLSQGQGQGQGGSGGGVNTARL